MRRGKQCWYQRNDVDLMAINDGLMLENSVYYLIQKHFKKENCYVHLLETVHTMSENILSIHREVPQHCSFPFDRAIIYYENISTEYIDNNIRPIFGYVVNQLRQEAKSGLIYDGPL